MIPAEELLTGIRWEILRALAEQGDATATELAKRANTTLPSISQAMKLLEAYGYVLVRRKRRVGPGKPTNIYALKKGVLNLTYCRDGFARKEALALDTFEEMLLNILFVPKQEREWVMKFLCLNPEVLELADAIAYVNSNGKEIHLLVISSDLEKFRKEYSNMILKGKGQQQKIVCWSHDEKEAIEGLQRKEKYFIDLFKTPYIITDAEKVIARIKEAGR